jgi:hypothetical protein
MFRGKEIRPLGFSRREEHIGERAVSGVGHLASPWGGAAKGWAAPPYGEPGSWLPSVSSSIFAKLR